MEAESISLDFTFVDVHFFPFPFSPTGSISPCPHLALVDKSCQHIHLSQSYAARDVESDDDMEADARSVFIEEQRRYVKFTSSFRPNKGLKQL
ncbi:hypothetical protein IE53DRAFT_385298 [Violaceomyces palustris]|uniref:Uncharacterized protein n=1 Tax=Violaceomyces palustris TaxID=1673888 RepID=A0ACD0P2M7_9BASI|nr:hypothetical protein IE53DRAFT_385298 [Violaceomyces palustris]